MSGAGTDPLQARTGSRLVVAADAPRRDDQLIAIPSPRSALRSWRQTKTPNLSARLQRPAAHWVNFATSPAILTQAIQRMADAARAHH